MLEGITRHAVDEVGAGTEVGLRVAIVSYRETEAYKELDAMEIYVADQQAAEAANRYLREKGAKISFSCGL